MQIYNSLTHKKEAFYTHKEGEVTMYTCGPTVYHFAHIGNLRSYIMGTFWKNTWRISATTCAAS